MLTGNIAAAQHGKPDIAFLARSCLALAHHIRHIIQRHTASACCGLTKCQRRTGRGINLVMMMRFQNLDIPAVSQLRCHLFDQP